MLILGAKWMFKPSKKPHHIKYVPSSFRRKKKAKSWLINSTLCALHRCACIAKEFLPFFPWIQRVSEETCFDIHFLSLSAFHSLTCSIYDRKIVSTNCSLNSCVQSELFYRLDLLSFCLHFFPSKMNTSYRFCVSNKQHEKNLMKKKLCEHIWIKVF